jgi:hypothetical protein
MWLCGPDPFVTRPAGSLGFQSKKKNNIVGVQTADLCAHPCARHILNPARPNRAFEVAKKHIYSESTVSGWSLFPVN